jgi:hypothetical protein
MEEVRMEHEVVSRRGIAHDSESLIFSGSVIELGVGIGAVILAILGLVGKLPEVLLAVAVIGIGGAFIVKSRSIISRFHVFVRETSDVATDDLALGMTTEFTAGVAGIVLGLLALMGFVPATLLSVGAVVFGLTLMIGVGVENSLSEIETACGTSHHRIRKTAKETISAISAVPMLLGISAAVLGILSIVGIVAPTVLMLTAMLAVGGAMVFNGLASTADVLGFTRICEPTEGMAHG